MSTRLGGRSATVRPPPVADRTPRRASAADNTPAYTRKTSSSFTALFHRRLEQRLVDERWKFLLDVGTVRDQLDHQDDDEMCVGIDSVHRSIRAAPPEGSDRVESIRAVPVGCLET